MIPLTDSRPPSGLPLACLVTCGGVFVWRKVSISVYTYCICIVSLSVRESSKSGFNIQHFPPQLHPPACIPPLYFLNRRTTESFHHPRSLNRRWTQHWQTPRRLRRHLSQQRILDHPPLRSTYRIVTAPGRQSPTPSVHSSNRITPRWVTFHTMDKRLNER